MCNNLCIIYVHGILYTELFLAVDTHVKFCTVASLESVSIVLPVISAFVTSTMNCVFSWGPIESREL